MGKVYSRFQTKTVQNPNPFGAGNIREYPQGAVDLMMLYSLDRFYYERDGWLHV